MKCQLITLREAAAELGVPAHVVVYAIVSGRIAEPLKISGRRMFSPDDVERIRDVLKQKRGKERS
jgi:DNA-binding transcriptional MerR regulator